MSVHYAATTRPPRTPWLPTPPAREVVGIVCLAVRFAWVLRRRTTPTRDRPRGTRPARRSTP